MTAFFFWIGVLATVTVVVSLFFALGRRPKRLWAGKVPPIDSEDFLRGVAGIVNSPLQSGGTAELLDNGDQFFPALVKAIGEAKKTINFMVYIWERGKASDQVFGALIERARAGVEVRILLDGFGGLRVPRRSLHELEAAGGKVGWFRLLRLGSLLRFYKRNHRRAIVIDGCLGFTGGMAVGDKWLGNGISRGSWRDSMVRVTGPMAGNLQSAFAELWAYCRGEILIGPSFFPSANDERHVDAPRHASVVSSPSSEEHPLRLFFLVSFAAARKKLYIASSYFVPDKHIRGAVCQQARDGVDVRILLPNRKTDAKPIRLASHSYFQELLDAGVRIFEYQPSMMHAKVVIVDDEWSIVGSANMDIRSKELNIENVLGILDAKLAAQIEASFVRDLERSKEIVGAEWRRRGFGQRVLERLAVMFAEQY
jgi:cardiolipin synthase